MTDREAIARLLSCGEDCTDCLTCAEHDEALAIAVGALHEREERSKVDAVPVVHGRWIDEGAYVTTAYGSLDVYQCSNCNREITIDDYDNYCPNCGARMDGGEKE